MKIVKIIKNSDAAVRYIKDWYSKEYPNDDTGLEQLSNCPGTFDEVVKIYKEKGEQAAFDRFYPCDTQVANRVFREVEKRMKRSGK